MSDHVCGANGFGRGANDVCPACSGSGKGTECGHCHGVGMTCGTPFPPLEGCCRSTAPTPPGETRCPHGPKEPPFPRCKLTEGHEGPCDWSPAPVSPRPEGLDFGKAQKALQDAGVPFPDFIIPQPARDTLDAQHRAALAAKDVRIKELEGLLAKGGAQ